MCGIDVAKSPALQRHAFVGQVYNGPIELIELLSCRVMKSWVNFFGVLVLLASTTVFAEKADLALLNIDRIGPDQLQQLKNHSNVDWWIEMGDQLLVAASDNQDTKVSLPQHAQIIARHQGVELSQLAFRSSGHCLHDDSAADKQFHEAFDQLQAYVANSGFELVSTAAAANKTALMAHQLMMPFEKNKVLAYQIANRQVNALQFNSDTAGLLDQVDQDRYFANIQTLASHDRMEEAGMVAAGNWLVNQFAALGLETSTLSSPAFVGFNVMGFKAGTTRADEWYVVGAHLDSRNQTWNDNLASPGAEDNASGCAGVLEMATALSDIETAASVLFVCFNEEEIGSIGAIKLINNLRLEGNFDKVKYMMNMDMISTHPGAQMTMSAGTDKAEYVPLAEILAANGELYTDIIWQVNPNACCTDFDRFTANNIPSVSSTIPDPRGYQHYHTSTDLPQYVDPVQGIQSIQANLATLADWVGVDVSGGFPITAAHSGMWYNPAQSGHGVTVEILPGNAMLVVWYVFDQAGNQIWLVGAGNYEGSTAEIEVSISEQGIFPPDFVAADVNTTVWGTLNFNFTDCNNVDFSWQPAAGVDYAAGELALTRLTGIDGLSCSD